MRELPEVKSAEGVAALNAELNRLSSQQSLGVPSENGKAGALSGVYVTFTGTGSEQAVSHTLGRTPVGWIIVGKSAAGDAYEGTRTWGADHVFFVGTSSVRFRVMLF